MDLDRQQLTTSAVDGDRDGRECRPSSSPTQPVDGHVEDGNKTPRLPRWTRQEILVLIKGKQVVENRVRRGRVGLGSGHVEPKWASISEYCKRYGVNRGPVQCRKRWSNLAGDFKKIKEWESGIKEEMESFWLMRNDLRRERKLPGFFDKEVYDILESGSDPDPGMSLDLGLGPAAELGVKEETDFDSGSAAAEEALSIDMEAGERGISAAEKEAPLTGTVAPVPISEKQYQPFRQECPGQGTTNEKQPTSHPEMGSASEGRKRKRVTTEDEEPSCQLNLFANILEKNNKILTAQLEAQSLNLQLDREQQKENADCFLAVLNKVADALGKIADKL